MNILQQIFTDYYEEIKYTLHPRFSEMENIDKLLSCGDPSFGGAATAAFVLPVVISTICSALPLCLLK